MHGYINPVMFQQLLIALQVGYKRLPRLVERWFQLIVAHCCCHCQFQTHNPDYTLPLKGKHSEVEKYYMHVCTQVYFVATGYLYLYKMVI